MGIFDDEITLPGVITHVEADYSYGFDSSLFGTTDSEVVIGTAFNGPVGEPTPVYSVEHAQYIFGDVYDAKKRQEVSLVAGIQDAWDRGCRTIYAVRLGGKDMYKDFGFKIDSKYKLRLSSQFPSNIGKECYMRFSESAGVLGGGELSFYKPTSRATIAEKKRGLATESGVMKTTIKLYDSGLTKDDRLVDMISLFNRNAFNNVLMLSIVDAEGNDVTKSPDVYDLPIGALYSGVYFIGRDHTNEKAVIETKTEFELVTETVGADGVVRTNKPYSNFTGSYFRKLKCNTDVTLPYPIYGTINDLRAAISGAGVSIVEDWDFLEVAELSDRVFVPDAVDYEETSLSKFEIYRRLGCGYAVTAHAIRRTSNGKELTPRIKEAASDDKNKILPITEGIYSVLQDANMKYRALVCANADDDINGKLPRATDFEVASANTAEILGGDITAKAIVERTDLKTEKKYEISFENIENGGQVGNFANMDNVDTSNIYKVIAGVTKEQFTGVKAHDNVAEVPGMKASDYANGTIFAVDNTTLYRVGVNSIQAISGAGLDGDCFLVNGTPMTYSVKDNKLVAATIAAGKKFILGDSMDHVFVFQIDGGKTTNIGDLKSLMSNDQDKVIVAADNIAAPGYVNKVVVRSNMFDTTTVEELVEMLNQNEIFGRLFTASLTEDGLNEKDQFVQGIAKAAAVFGTPAVPAAGDKPAVPAVPGETVALTDRVRTYDYNLYIPYRTTDNFLRQMAQHCTYTELKTAPTHGIVGTNVITNTGLSSVRDKVNKLLVKDFDLYAKNNVGCNMLDSNDLPYPIGKNVSMVCGQYPVTVGKANYTYNSNGAAGYGAMVCTLPLEQSSTGQPIALTTISYQLTSTQLGQLTEAGIVTFKNSFTKGIVVTDGITMAPAESIYRRLSTSRIVGACEELIRAAAEPFIGKENHQANRDALNTAIKSNLDKIKGTLIEDYQFTMSSDRSLKRLSRIEILYQIIPIYEIREVRNSIKMTDQITSTAAA